MTDTTLVSMTSIRLRKCKGQWVRQWTSHAVCCEFSFNIQTRLSSVRGSMTKLVPLARRYHIARESRFVGAGIRISEHGYIDAADRCCLRRLTWSNICLIFTAATRLSFHQQSPVAVCYTSPPGCCTRA